MKRSKFISFAAVLVASLMLLASCGPAAGGGGGGGGGAAEASAAQGDWERTDWRQAFPELVTVTIADEVPGNPVWPEGHDMFNTLWRQRWIREFNVDTEMAWASDEYELQANLVIAAGNIPDMMWVNAVQFQQLLDANLLEDLTDVINRWSSPGLLRMLEMEQTVFDTSHRDGRAFSIPRLHYGFITQAPYLWVRRDLYAQAGSPAINTVADLENLMLYFQNNFDVPFPMALNDSLNSFWRSVPMWHGDVGNDIRIWVDAPDGSIMSAFETQGFADAIAAWARWYEMGLIHPEFATIDWDRMSGEIVSGSSAVEFAQNWRGWPWNSIVENIGEDSYLFVLPMPTIDGTRARIPMHFVNYGHNIVRRGFEHPEILPILLSDYVYMLNEASLAGNLTVEYISQYTTNEMHHTSGPFWIAFPHYDDVVNVNIALEAHHAGNEPSFTSSYQVLYFNEIIRWTDDRDLPGFGRYAQMGHPQSALVMGVYYEDNGMFLFCRQWGPDPQEVLDFGSITMDILEEGITRIIMGLDPVDNWPVVLENWRQAGGNTMTEAVNREFGN